jgi:D-aminopeptidase
LTPQWALACADMTRDVQAVVQALFQAGVETVVVKDFHRTGYNLLPEWIDGRARVDSGYALGPVPGMGDPGDAQAVLFLGLHAASGTEGFLAHTLTSRLSDVRVDGRPLPEVALFAALLAPFGIRPIFFSGCPQACRQAQAVVPGITVHAIDKNGVAEFDAGHWRAGLARRAAASLLNTATRPLDGTGPFEVRVSFREGAAAARKAARRWNLQQEGAAVRFAAADLAALFVRLSRICYLRPALLPVMPAALYLHNLQGRLGRAWVRRFLRRRAAGEGRIRCPEKDKGWQS